MSGLSGPGRPVFSCRLCGECCRGVGGIVLRAHDQTRLAFFLGVEENLFRKRYTVMRRGKTQLGVGPDARCVFFDPTALCTVHPARPDICRAWPFFRGNLLDPVSLRLAKDSCPGIDPAVSFSAFAEAGVAFLTQRGLVCAPGPDSPSALCLSPLSAPDGRPEDSS